MIQILNSFLPQHIFNDLQTYCRENEFVIHTVADKSFLVLQTPPEIIPYLEISGFEMTLTFIRKAHKDFDDTWRIHADSHINGKPTHLARVLYLNNEGELDLNGTCFWNHSKYSDSLPLDTPLKEFDRMLLEDAEDLSKWTKTDVVVSKPNRLLTYQSNLFHSKWPNKIKKGERIILVAFYSKLDKCEVCEEGVITPV